MSKSWKKQSSTYLDRFEIVEKGLVAWLHYEGEVAIQPLYDERPKGIHGLLSSANI